MRQLALMILSATFALSGSVCVLAEDQPPPSPEAKKPDAGKPVAPSPPKAPKKGAFKQPYSSVPGGVVQVTPERSDPGKHNQKLTLAVRQALSRAQGLDVAEITVRARGGAVTLSGAVPDQSDAEMAAEVVKAVDGVTVVHNKLTVGQ